MSKFVPSFPTSDLTRTVDYYREALGFDLIRISGKGDVMRARVRLGDVEIIFRSKEVGDRRPFLQRGLDAEPVILHIEVDDVLGLYRKVQGRVPIVEELERSLFGMQRFSVEDPEGIILTFTQGM